MAIQTITQDFSSSAGFTFDASKIEFASGVARFKKDPKFSLLLRFEGSGASIADDSTYAHTVNVNGETTQSGDQSKFGSKSCFMDGGDNDDWNINDHSSLQYAGNDFTEHFWFYPTDNSTLQHLTGKRLSTGKGPFVVHLRENATYNNAVHMAYSVDGVNWEQSQLEVAAGGQVNFNAWNHLCVMQKSGKLYAFLNGSLGSSFPVTPSNDLVVVSDPKFFGRRHPDTLQGYVGYSDEFVLVMGEAIFDTAGFTPPVVQSGPYFETTEAIELPDFGVTDVDALTSFAAETSEPVGFARFQLSDDGATWKYHNGTSWVAATSSDHNTESEVNANINTFPVATGKVFVRAFLSAGDGTNTPSIDSVTITYADTATISFPFTMNVFSAASGARTTTETDKFVAGDFGAKLDITTDADLDAATAITLEATKPGGETVSLALEKLTNNTARYIVQSGDFDDPGIWNLRLKLVFGSAQYSSEVFWLKVLPSV